jgi:hypothetical protein
MEFKNSNEYVVKGPKGLHEKKSLTPLAELPLKL